VITDDLRVRSRPEVSDDSEVLEPLLQDGVAVLVLGGPVEASRHQWYQVAPVVAFEGEQYPVGWVAAAGRDGEPWLEAHDEPCPPTPASVEELALLNETEQRYYEITCFSRVPITFEARVGSPEIGCGAEAPWGTEPEWFDPCAASGEYLVPVDDPEDDGPSFVPMWHPDVDLSIAPEPGMPGPVVTVTGAFDHPAAATCQSRQNDSEGAHEPPDPALVILDCRTRFVITSLEPAAG
jgi:hypothetical protein